MGEHNHPEITMNSIPMAQHMGPIRDGDWKALAHLLSSPWMLVEVMGRRVERLSKDEVSHHLVLLSRDPIAFENVFMDRA